MKQQDQMESKDILKMLQQKIGNLELTVHAMMNVIDVDQGEINEEAEKIVEEMKNISNNEEAQKEVRERVKNYENNNS